MAIQTEGYQEDLAYIHDVGFGGFALKSAPGLLEILRRHGVTEGLIVDLGCGSGLWSCELASAGYTVLGVDQSALPPSVTYTLVASVTDVTSAESTPFCVGLCFF